MSDELNKKSGKALAWSSVTEIISKLITPIINILLARLLTPDAFGAVATITMVISFAEIFTDAGFQKYIIQHEFKNEDELNKSTNVAFVTNLSMSLILVMLIAIFKDPLASIVGSANLGNAIAIASISIILVAFSSIQMARFKRDFDFKSLFFVRIGASIIPIVVTVPLAFIMRNFWALVIGTLAVNLFNAITLTIKSKWKPKLFYSFEIFKEMFSFSAWTLLESIVIWLTVNIDIFIVGTKLSDHYLGIYKTSMQTVNSYMSIITAAILPVLFSTLSRYQNDDRSFKNTYWNFFKYTALLLIPLGAGIFVYSDLITQILLGSQWQEASGFIGLWGLMSGFSIIFGNLASEVYRSKGNPKISSFSQILQIVFLIPAVLFAINYDFTTLYTIRAFMRIPPMIINVFILKIVYKFNFSDMLKFLSAPLFCSTIMTLCAIYLNTLIDGLLWQLFCILICVIFYFSLILIICPNLRKDVYKTLKNTLFKR